jgi:hypothetical protein
MAASSMTHASTATVMVTAVLERAAALPPPAASGV